MVFKITPAGALTTLYSFCAQAGCADGTGPGALIQGADGNFYGTTTFSASNTCVNGCGTVFKITPTGVLTTLYQFTAPGGYGADPLAGLVQGTDGNFYGTTGSGGSGTACSGGCGIAFKMTPQGAFTTLYNFTGTGAEGWSPGALLQAADGNFYGTTGLGGSSSTCGFYGCGTVFKMTPQGAVTTLTSLNFNVGSEPRGRSG
ncbi:MAG TPA: choice-of-anchor tandem repeat GloVer-containing protein [Terriglobales bacterium]